MDELKKAASEKEAIDKQVAEVASQVQEINAKIEERKEQAANRGKGKGTKKGKGAKKKQKKPMAEGLKGSILEAANSKDTAPLRESLVDPGSSREKSGGSGCCLVL